MNNKPIQVILRVLIAGVTAILGNFIMHLIVRSWNPDLALLSWLDAISTAICPMLIFGVNKNLTIPEKWLPVALGGLAFGLLYSLIMLL